MPDSMQRLQVTGDDVVLEITETATVKRRLSQTALLEQKSYLERSIANFQAQLDETNAALATITTAQDSAAAAQYGAPA